MTGFVRSHFLNDHRRVEGLQAPLLAALAAHDHPTASHLWSGLASGLLTHFDVEERLVIPALLVAARERDTRVLIQEHRHIRARLSDLGRGLGSGGLRQASLHAFFDEMRAHATTEDRLLYQFADALLDAADRDAAVDALANAPVPR